MSGVWLLPSVVIILGSLILAGAIFFVVRINMLLKKIDVEPNCPLIDCTTRTQFTNGYALGLVKSEVPCKNGTVRVEFYPLDHKQGENKPKPEIQCVIIAKQNIQRFARGEMSSHREVIKVIPRSKLDLPEKMRNTLESDWQSAKGQLAQIEKWVGKNISEGDLAMTMYHDVVNRTGMATITVAQINEQMKAIEPLFKRTEEKVVKIEDSEKKV